MLEELADLEHKQWSEWMNYFFSKAKLFQGSQSVILEFSNEDFRRWTRQMETPYRLLGDSEKESDRKFARKVLEVIQNQEKENTFK